MSQCLKEGVSQKYGIDSDKRPAPQTPADNEYITMRPSTDVKYKKGIAPLHDTRTYRVNRNYWDSIRYANVPNVKVINAGQLGVTEEFYVACQVQRDNLKQNRAHRWLPSMKYFNIDETSDATELRKTCYAPSNPFHNASPFSVLDVNTPKLVYTPLAKFTVTEHYSSLIH